MVPQCNTQDVSQVPRGAYQTKLLSVEDIWFPTGVSTLCNCYAVGSSGNRFFLGGVGRLSHWSCFVGTEFEQPVIDSKAEWAPRLCHFRVGQLKSLAIQILLNGGLSRSSSSTSKNVSSFVYHELIFFLFCISKTLILLLELKLFFHHSLKK